MARPTIHTPELARSILKRLADGESLRSICRAEEMPDRSTVYDWVLDDVDGFSRQYARVREMQAHALADDQVDIADNGSNDWMERNDPDNPGWLANGEHIQRSRLRFDARRWAASKILPKVYGDRVDVNHGGGVNIVHAPYNPALLTEEQREVMRDALLTIGPTIEGEKE
jgi:hypothetical protein